MNIAETYSLALNAIGAAGAGGATPFAAFTLPGPYPAVDPIPFRLTNPNGNTPQPPGCISQTPASGGSVALAAGPTPRPPRPFSRPVSAFPTPPEIRFLADNPRLPRHQQCSPQRGHSREVERDEHHEGSPLVRCGRRRRFFGRERLHPRFQAAGARLCRRAHQFSDRIHPDVLRLEFPGAR